MSGTFPFDMVGGGDLDWKDDEDVVAAIQDADPPVRARILAEAIRLTTVVREGEHGKPADQFGLTARLWTNYLNASCPGCHVTAKDVAIMLALLKISRIVSGRTGNQDNFVDLAGYAALAGELE